MLLVIVRLGIWVVAWAIVDRVLLWGIGLPGEVHALVHSDVHFLQEDAISGHSVTLLDVDNITDHEISYRDGLARPEGASVHRDGLAVDLILQLEVLPLLDPITCSSNKCSEEKTTVDGQRLDISSRIFAEHRKD